MSNGMKTVGKVIAWFLAILLVLGLIGVGVYYVAKEQGITYLVEHGGEKYYANTEGASLWLMPGESFSFKVQSLEGENVDYAVAITSSPETNFEFTADDKLYVWYGSSEKDNDYTELFKPEKAEDGFTVTIPPDFGLEAALEWKYGKNIGLPEELPTGDYFLLTVTVSGSSIAFPFNTEKFRLELDPPGIVF